MREDKVLRDNSRRVTGDEVTSVKMSTTTVRVRQVPSSQVLERLFRSVWPMGVGTFEPLQATSSHLPAWRSHHAFTE